MFQVQGNNIIFFGVKRRWKRKGRGKMCLRSRFVSLFRGFVEEGKKKASSGVVSLLFLFLQSSPEMLWIPGRGSLESKEGVEQLALSKNLFLLVSAQGTVSAGSEEEEERPGMRKIL